MSKDTEQELWDAIEEYVKDCMQLSSMAKAQHCKSYADLTGIVGHLCGSDDSSTLKITLDFDEEEIEGIRQGFTDEVLQVLREAPSSDELKDLAMQCSAGQTQRGFILVGPSDLGVFVSSLAEKMIEEHRAQS